MEETEKKKSWKDKIRENKEEVAFWGVLGGATLACVGLYVWAVVAANKENAAIMEAAAEQRRFIMEAINRGASVLPNSDGSFWIINNTPASVN